jgi:glycosyltransferase involved in cell wall biosynthesis
LVIGDLESFGDYVSCTDKHDRNRTWALLQALDTHVRFIPTTVPHRDVLALLQRSDFYLLPTYADTFGYTALEAQACGTVVVATDVGSLPEFISSRTGIVVPLDEHLDGSRLPPSTAKRVKADFTDRLSLTLASALEIGLEKRKSLRATAIKQLRRRHCPRHHSLRLETTYMEALTP